MLWVACLSLSITPFLGLPTSPENYATLVLPISLFILLVEERWEAGGKAIIFTFLTIVFVGLWFIFLSAKNPYLAMYLPAPAIAIIVLYWIRWWATQPPRTWIDTISNRTPS
jgi:hypothetical protein